MSKLILRSNYFKNEPAVHKSNYIKYLGTREGVEMNPETLPRFFYEDQDMHGKKENYIEYISDRPGAVHVDGAAHGLFSDKGLDINLEQVMDEVANHRGTVWINVISLKREDATRLGYDNVETWQKLLRSHVADISESFKIKPGNLQWYAAFHNEGHHPHVHMVVYSKGTDGHLTRKGINQLKSKLTDDIFKYELTNLYAAKSMARQSTKDQARRSLLDKLDRLAYVEYRQDDMSTMMKDLADSLRNIKGKKVYGYLHKNIKDKVDAIAKELCNYDEVQSCYYDWIRYQTEIGHYKYGDMKIPDLIDNKEFKSIKNMIIREAMNMNYYQEKYGRPRDEEFGEEMVSQVGALFKQLENMFRQTIPPEEPKVPITDAKYLQWEKEIRAALGQKEDDHEVAENKKYISM